MCAYMCVSGSVSMSVFVCLGGSSQAVAHGLWLRGSMYKSRHKFGQIEAYIYNVLYVCIPVLGSCRLQTALFRCVKGSATPSL